MICLFNDYFLKHYFLLTDKICLKENKLKTYKEVTMNNNQNRAQIFLSFDALKGFRQKLKEQEKITVSPKILSEDDLIILDRKIKQIKTGMIIQITYFHQNEYIQLKGMLSKISYDHKILQIVKTQISFKNIIDIQTDE